MSHREKTQKPMEPCGAMIAGWSCTQIEPTMSGLSLPLLLYVFCFIFLITCQDLQKGLAHSTLWQGATFPAPMVDGQLVYQRAQNLVCITMENPQHNRTWLSVHFLRENHAQLRAEWSDWPKPIPVEKKSHQLWQHMKPHQCKTISISFTQCGFHEGRQWFQVLLFV